MSTIGDKFSAAYASVTGALGNAYGSAKETATKAGTKAQEAGQTAGKFAFNVDAQREGFDGVSTKISNLYFDVAFQANRTNNTLETKGEGTLRTPIKAMQDYKASPIEIKSTDSGTTKFAKQVANKVKAYHEVITVKGEEYSRVAGDKAHALTSLALSPIRFVAKLLQVEVAGKLIQNSIALAVGFAVRGLVLAMTQLGHLAPYALAGAVVGGIGAGLVALAKISLPAAIAAGIGLILVAQQAQTYSLGKDVHDLRVGKQAKVDAKQEKADAEAIEKEQATAKAKVVEESKAREAQEAKLAKSREGREARLAQDKVEVEAPRPGFFWRAMGY